MNTIPTTSELIAIAADHGFDTLTQPQADAIRGQLHNLGDGLDHTQMVKLVALVTESQHWQNVAAITAALVNEIDHPDGYTTDGWHTSSPDRTVTRFWDRNLPTPADTSAHLVIRDEIHDGRIMRSAPMLELHVDNTPLDRSQVCDLIDALTVASRALTSD